MTDAQIAKSVQDEHIKLQQIADELRKAVVRTGSIGPESWLGRLRERFEHFRAHMYHRMALEETGGFLKEVAEHRPTLSKEVNHCRAEHKEILGMADAIYQEMMAAQPEQTDALKDLQLRVLHLLSEVAHHEQHESLLVLFVFNTDIGGNG